MKKTLCAVFCLLILMTFGCETANTDPDPSPDPTDTVEDSVKDTEKSDTSHVDEDTVTNPTDDTDDDAWRTLRDQIISDDITIEGDFTISDEWIKRYGDQLFLGDEISDIKHQSGFISYTVPCGEKEQNIMYASFECYKASVGGKKRYISITETVECSDFGEERKLCDISVSADAPDDFDSYTRCRDVLRIVNSDPRFTGVFDPDEPRSQGNVSYFDLTELSMDILKKNVTKGIVPTLDYCLTDGKSLFCRYYVINAENKTMDPTLLIRIDTKTRKAEQISEEDFIKLPDANDGFSPDGRYSAESDDNGYLYVKNEETGERTLVSEAILTDTAVGNFRSPNVWGFTDDNKMIYYVNGYESLERVGVYDCASGKNLFVDGMHSPVAYIDGVLYTVATQYSDGKFEIYSVPLNAETLVETPVSDPNRLVSSDYDGSYRIYKDPSSGKTELILLQRVSGSETTFLRLGIGENGFELIQTEQIDSRFCVPNYASNIDGQIVINCQRLAGCGDSVVMIKLK